MANNEVNTLTWKGGGGTGQGICLGFDANNTVITNVADAVNDGDSVSQSFMLDTFIEQGNTPLKFTNKMINSSDTDAFLTLVTGIGDGVLELNFDTSNTGGTVGQLSVTNGSSGVSMRIYYSNVTYIASVPFISNSTILLGVGATAYLSDDAGVLNNSLNYANDSDSSIISIRAGFLAPSEIFAFQLNLNVLNTASQLVVNGEFVKL